MKLKRTFPKIKMFLKYISPSYNFEEPFAMAISLTNLK